MRSAWAKAGHVEEPAAREPRPPFSWPAALESGLISGALLIFLPEGVPWSALNAFSGAVMGRSIGGGEFQIGAVVIHMLLAIVYGIIVAGVVQGIRSWRALPAGAAVGLALYGINVAVVSFALPQWSGSEIRAVFAHVLFGLFTAAIYAGFTQRKRSA